MAAMIGGKFGAGDASRLFRRLHGAGAEIRPEGGLRFRLGAPAQDLIEIARRLAGHG